MINKFIYQHPERLLTSFMWLHAPVLVAMAMYLQTHVALVTGLSLFGCLLAELSLRFAFKMAAIAIAIGYVMQAIALITGLDGYVIQHDAHIYFFAIMAYLTMLSNLHAVITLVVCVVFYEVSIHAFGHEFMLHGQETIEQSLLQFVMLILEAIVLGLVIKQRLELRARSHKAHELAVAEAAKAHRASESIKSAEENSRLLRERTMASLSEAFGGLVDAAVAGDFSRRIDAEFDDPGLDHLATSMNRLVETVELGISEACRTVGALAEGDFRQKMEGQFCGDFAKLQDGVNLTIAQLSALIAEIKETNSDLEIKAHEMNSDASTLANRAETQAASLQEAASSMNNVLDRTQQNADSAQHVSMLAKDAKQHVDGISDIVSKTEGAMVDITESATKISHIVDLIEGISFQTNLLALNAAVEAARAGDAGAGFAVVASEVRSLAQRAAGASNDIKALIEESSDNTERGVKLVENTRTTLEQVVRKVHDVSHKVSEIGASSLEQASTIGEMTQTVSTLDTITQENTSIADRSAGNARMLAEQSDALSKLVKNFLVAEPKSDHLPNQKIASSES